MENLFRYGEPVIGKNFADRKKELEEPKVEILSGQNVIIFEFTFGEEEICFDESLGLPQRLAEHLGKRVVVVFSSRRKLKGSLEMEDVEKTFEELVKDSEASYIEIWGSLPLSQEKVLLAIARGEGDFLSSL
ncbi:hypothetical protein PFDSM3638_06385 [Pyrococcus furiosus DSM 3638]|uniref:Uncharacterized protein n=3 Tax=Pyrococcus furiosus TaxID=2261 RepID=Q8U1D1_PYRFU|nr:hypothetical protein [Pyrococcus furiosus]AAL81404.1 hypothetical protein PF1280 [Pyrococcus furiosus DSM 3638]AFN04064.1 hypothetical protein PFC_05615 [Pyrococcus furiosus COM1]QEK78921.1 hypothetical protein PFDSM3638_06385 [Pyrococcus furiosus DSM 3638]